MFKTGEAVGEAIENSREQQERLKKWETEPPAPGTPPDEIDAERAAAGEEINYLEQCDQWLREFMKRAPIQTGQGKVPKGLLPSFSSWLSERGSGGGGGGGAVISVTGIVVTGAAGAVWLYNQTSQLAPAAG